MSHVVASVVSTPVVSTVSASVASTVSVSVVLVSVVVHVVSSTEVHVATKTLSFVASSANTNVIVHNKNAPTRRKEIFFILYKIKYKMFLCFWKQMSIKYRLKTYSPISYFIINELWL